MPQPVIVVVIVVIVLLLAATVSAVAAYRLSGSAAWNREYNKHGLGLAIEVAFLFLTFASSAAIAIIMKDSFRILFLERAWRTPLFIASAVVVTAGVSIYMLAVAPGTLAAKQGVPAAKIGAECRLPYLLYTPFSVISWIGAVLPVLALIVVSIHSDSSAMETTRVALVQEGAAAISRCESEVAAVKGHAGIYDIAYRESLDAIQRMISRYLWVIGVFMVSIMVILNTRITSSFTEESVDAFKWLMWVLLAVALGVCLFGFSRYQAFRDLAIETQLGLQALANRTGSLDLRALSREALLALRNQGPVQFLRMTLESGSLGLMFSGYAMQIVLAKVTHRSVVGMIFPRHVARFLDAFMLGAEEPKG